MFSVRKTKTASGATAIQVVRYANRKTIVCVHIGSTHNQAEIDVLKQQARRWIEKATQQTTLFPPTQEQKKETVLVLNKTQYLGVRYTFMYELLSKLLHRLSFHTLDNQLLLDLVIMRIIHPASKLESLELLSEMFGIVYHRGHVYEAIASCASFKERVEKNVMQFAKQHFAFDFSIVFYDVTTLYVEGFHEDEDATDEEGNVVEKGLRKTGFSKDNKVGQPQIVIGLIVNEDGFPVAYDIFEGNTFEGDTFIPAMLRFKNTHAVPTLTVVADAAMISLDNVEKLQEHHLSYIVGARMGNLALVLIKQINNDLNGGDGACGRVDTDRGTLVYDFSLKRYQKDKREMEKQIARAKKLIQKKQAGKRAKFLKHKGKTAYELNTALMEKTERLLGIKGYHTNLSEKNADNATIIRQYHTLWQVEKAFRIAKSDLAMRPMYHFKKQTIEAHILICFMALSVCKYMEFKTNRSTRKIVKLLKGITTARILNKLTGEEIVMRQEIPKEIEQLWKTLCSSY